MVVEKDPRVNERKLVLQQRFDERLGLKVDQPRSGGSGTSNTGIVAKRAFDNSELLSEILEISVDLLKNYKIILLSSLLV